MEFSARMQAALVPPVTRMEFAWVAGALAAVKLAWLVVDHTLRYYMGDSMTYLHSAAFLTGTGGRSFLYGWTLRFTALPFDSPVAVIVNQAAWSVLICIALFIFLRVALRLPFWWSAVPSWLLATEPAQVFLERMVMAETLGLLAFVSMFLVFSRYLATGDLRWYLLACLGGLAAAAFRMNFLPIAIGLGLTAPLLRVLLWPPDGSSQRWPAWRHIGLAMLILGVTNLAYTQAYGRATHYPPGYLAYTGMMRIGLVAPLIRPEHFEGTGVSGTILQEVELPLDDHWQRGHHIWRPDGLWPLLEKRSDQPELVARTVTRRALLSEPLGLLRINIATLGGYFHDRRSELRMLDDIGVIPPSDRDLELIREWTGWDARGIDALETPARRFFAGSTTWLTLCLFALAPLALATAAIGWRTDRREQYLLLSLASLGLVANHLLFAHIVSYRYIHPFPWFVLANLSIVLAAATSWWVHRSPKSKGQAGQGRPAS
ncbi:hypothetical protein [Luteimonas suaedae]|uniref:hypothetical protein n=1 Tax=Luteimonas suaedae TaxID=2605430 RepID=UPI001659CE41|nr:hypothetical protein [Luteimonas suaedae]